MDKPPTPPGEQPPNLAAGHFSEWLWRLGIVFVLYILAVGPAAKVHRAYPQTRAAIEGLYFWVEPLERGSPVFRSAVDWYARKVWKVR